MEKIEQQAGTVDEVQEAEHEVTLELKELLYGGFEELDMASLPSLQQIFDSQDLKRGRAFKEEE